MSTIYGSWKHEMAGDGFTSTITHVLREDGSYETHMIFGAADDCQQHIYHYGQFELGETRLKLTFASGERESAGCPDSADNMERREFTADEIAETLVELSQPMAYELTDNTLTVTVRIPNGGKMPVAYQRVG